MIALGIGATRATGVRLTRNSYEEVAVGFTDWIGGTRCAECGNRIQNQKIARTVMGATIWVCGTCDENSRAASRRERDAQAAAAIGQRADADIAEAMARIVLREYGTFCRSVFKAACGVIRLQHLEAFTYALAVSAYGFRGFLLAQLGTDRLDQVEERLIRYAFAGFIDGLVRNPAEQPKDAAPLDRSMLLLSCCDGYRKMAGIHQQNFLTLNGGERIAAYFAGLALHWFGEDLAVSSNEGRRIRLAECAANLWSRCINVGRLLQPELASIATQDKPNIEIDLPDSWLFRGGDQQRFYDPAMPQYNLLFSVRIYSTSADVPILNSARGFLRVLSPETEPVLLDSERAIGRYRTEPGDKGPPRESRHWILVQRKDRHEGWLALFTLSILVNRADTEATEAIVTMIDDRIQRARFIERSSISLCTPQTVLP